MRKEYRILRLILFVTLILVQITPLHAQINISDDTNDIEALPLELYMDSDADGISDLFEKKYYLSNPHLADTNLDGVDDGIAAAVGADPVSGVVSTTSSPLVKWPAYGDAHDCPVSGVKALMFKRVEGATGYKVKAFVNNNKIYERNFDFAAEELVIGPDKSFLNLSNYPYALGQNDITIQGYYGSPSNLHGLPTVYSFSCSGRAPEDNVIVDSVETWAGVKVFNQLHIKKDGYIAVPDNDSLTIIASTLTIDAGAGIIGGASADINLLVAGNMLISGDVHAGIGKSAQSMTIVANPGDDVDARGNSGKDGGHLRLFGGWLTVLGNASLRSGDGGHGGNVTAKGGDSDGNSRAGNAFAEAGRGGNGGDLVLFALLDLTQSSDDALYCGDGGVGGDSSATSGRGYEMKPSGSVGAGAGGGGDSGDLAILWTPTVGLAGSTATISIGGGSGGKPGKVKKADKLARQKPKDDCEREDEFDKTSIDGKRDDDGNCGCPMESEDGEPAGVDSQGNIRKGHTGGNGWYVPGEGAEMTQTGGDATGCGIGGDAFAAGGKGGNIKSISGGTGAWGISVGLDIVAPWAVLRRAGKGGDAFANGGKGGPCGVGKGGLGHALAGNGGFSTESPFGNGGQTQKGGHGGYAGGSGGSGFTGYSCCSVPQKPGGNGGRGGAADAHGGDGGNGALEGGKGGTAYVAVGNNGNGGSGCGPGIGAKKNIPYAEAGEGGDSTVKGKADSGQELAKKVEDGADGNDCCSVSFLFDWNHGLRLADNACWVWPQG